MRVPPSTASVATPLEGNKLFAPASARNQDPLVDLLGQFAPRSGRALELASGTGQHVVAFAAALPDLHWHPTDLDPARLASIDAYTQESGLGNIAPARQLNAGTRGWGAPLAPINLVVLVNLLHLISQSETEALISETSRSLAPGGRFVLYGPFMRAGELTSDGDRAFQASLLAQDPEIGYKDDFDTLDMLLDVGLASIAIIEMPANNLALISEKQG